MNKRVHEIAKEQGVPAKEILAEAEGRGDRGQGGVLERRRGAPRCACSQTARVPRRQQAPAARREAKQPAERSRADAPPERGRQRRAPPMAGPRPTVTGARRSGHEHKRPTRDSLQGERAPGTAGGRRRVVIDSQASRRAPGGGPPQSNQPPRRQRRGRRRRGVYDEEAEARPSRTAPSPGPTRSRSTPARPSRTWPSISPCRFPRS